MNYEVVTSKWRCQECGQPMRLYFEPSSFDGEGQPESYGCRSILCNLGHSAQPEFALLITEEAELELHAALEQGYKAAEVWVAPEEAQEESTSGGL